MHTSAELLRFALTALRDIDAGYPAREIASPENASMPHASGLAKLIGAIALHLAASGNLDADTREEIAGSRPDLQLPEPSPAEVAQANRESALRAIQEAGLSYADCVKALGGVDRDADPYAQAAVSKYVDGSDNDIEIDDTTMLSANDEGAWVAAWLWVSNADAGVHPWNDSLDDFLTEFDAFRQKPGVATLVSELVEAIGESAPDELIELFDEQRDDAKTALAADAANTCSDADEQEDAIAAVEEFFDDRIDNAFATNVALVLYGMGLRDGAKAVRERLGPVAA